MYLYESHLLLIAAKGWTDRPAAPKPDTPAKTREDSAPLQ
jgi:hypothetical protein